MNRLNKKIAFTLVELMVASALLFAILAGYLSSYRGIVKAADYSQGLSLAQQACLKKLEEIIAHDFGLIQHDYAQGATPGNLFDFNVTGPLSLTGKGVITITDRSDLYGGSWTRATGALGAEWAARTAADSVVYDDKMWIIAGHGSTDIFNDVWSSSDGVNWDMATASAFPAGQLRYLHACLVYDNKMWVMGGHSDIPNTLLNDIWYSNDGAAWIQLPASGHWVERMSHEALVYDGRMWVMGGYGYNGPLKNDVWNTSDGVNWSVVTANANWPARCDFGTLVYDNKIWIIGGYTFSDGCKQDVWYSSDGISWTPATTQAPWRPTCSPAVLAYDNKMWILGGWAPGVGYYNDVWYSSDGANWTKATNPAVMWSGRAGPEGLVYNNRMWIMAGGWGIDGGGHKNDVWYSLGFGRLLEVTINLCWRQHDGRLFGEDANLNGVEDSGEGDGDGVVESPVQLKILLSEKDLPSLRKIYLGRQ